MSAPSGEHDSVLNQLKRRRREARVVLWIEQLWPALWPAIGILGLLLCLALLGVPGFLPLWGQVGLLAVAGLALLVAVVTGLWRLRAPDAAGVDRRLELASGLSHRPLRALTDKPAFHDPSSRALWAAHVARAARQIANLRVGKPRPDMSRRDPLALRGALVVALLASFIIAGSDSGNRILRLFSLNFPAGQGAAAPLVQAWITPPSYTGVAPVFLKPEGGGVSVPAGSHLTVSVTGGLGEPSLGFGTHSTAFQTLDAGSYQADMDLTSGGHMSVRRLGRSVADWDIAAVADAPPMVAFAEPPGQNPRGLQTRLPWTATDDYGVTSLTAELRLHDRAHAPPIVVNIPVGGQKSARGVALPDLTAHPWAGLMVDAVLVAKDQPGQTGRSSVAQFLLPERHFRHPVAQAVLAIRKMLSVHPEARVDAIRALDAVAAAPQAFDNDTGVYLNLRGIQGVLAHDAGQHGVDDAQARMWELALHLEEGGAERTARALEAARDAVRQQLETMKNGAATPEQHDQQMQELQKRMQALREAIQQHLQALAEQARRNGDMQPYDPSAQQMSPRDLDRMAQQMMKDAQQGDMKSAEQQMAQLEQMLQQLQNASPQRGGKQDQQNAQRRQQGRQDMSAVQDMVQRQTGLLDKAQGRAQQQGDQRQPGQQPFGQQPFGQQPFGQQPFGQQPFGQQRGDQQPGDMAQDDQGQQPGQMPGQMPGQSPGQGQSPSAQQRQKEMRTQRALRRALGELMQQFGDLTGQVPKPLSDADNAMRQAGEALGQGRDGAAGAAQQQAIEALQKGGQQMSQQMSQQFGMSMQLGDGQQPGEGEGDGDQADGSDMQNGDNDSGLPGQQNNGRGGQRRQGQRDPLGRLTQDGSSGSDESSDVRVPDQAEGARTRDIQNELRRRGAQRSRPEEELQYIDRLLKPY